jgi:hypothetical protein
VSLCTCLYYGRGLTQTRVAPIGRSCPAHPTTTTHDFEQGGTGAILDGSVAGAAKEDDNR